MNKVMKKNSRFKIIVWDIVICGLLDGLKIVGEVGRSFRDDFYKF